MRKVKIISGAYGHHENGHLRVKDDKSEPFDLADEEAERIVTLGVAKYTDEINDSAVATPVSEDKEPDAGENSTESENGSESEEEADEDAPEYSVNSSASELRTIAKSVGITFKIGTTKEDMVAALDEHFKNDEDMPDMSAADPE